MATLANGNVYVCRAYCTLGVQLAINRVHVRIHTVVGAPTDADLAAIFNTQVATGLKNLMAIDASYRGVGVQRVLPLPATVQVFNITSQGSGTAPTPPLPKQVSGLCTLRTEFAGNRYRGRIFPPFPSEDDNESVNGRPTASYVTRLSLLVGGLDQPTAGGSGGNTFVMQPCLFNRSSGQTQDIISHTARTYWATQRRRGDFGPTNISPI